MSQPPVKPKIYHITHVDNLPSIIANGELISDAAMIARGGPTAPVGMSAIKKRRLGLPVSCHCGDNVGDYVPFYFCPRSIMLFVLHCANHPDLTYHGGQEPIVHLQADLYDVIAWADSFGRHWAFSPTNAGATYTQFSKIPVGTVPIYQAALGAIKSKGALVNMTADDIFKAIEEHAADGVDFVTVHCGVTRTSIDRLKNQGRVTDIVSRGGAILLGWILHNNKENPLYEQYDRLLDIAKRHDLTLSLGDGLRPGSIVDATDRAQIEELIILGELVARAREAGVQAMVEGPGHVPLDQIAANVELEKSVCQGAPFYVLGPLVTDIAAGYDHITGAIGGAIAAMAGADFLCYVTPSEHLGLPGTDDVRQGVMASRIAAHAADIARGVRGARETDRKMSVARKNLNWEEQAKLALDPEKVRAMHKVNTSSGDTCTMCGGMCAMKLVSEYLGSKTGKC